MRNSVLDRDVASFNDGFEFKDLLTDSSILITGGTGLIGRLLIKCLLSLSKAIKLYVNVRNAEKLQRLLYKEEFDRIEIIEGSLDVFKNQASLPIDYIIHGASPTTSKYFVDYPVETFWSIVEGTKNLLEYSKSIECKGIVFLSSLEVYGNSTSSKLLEEEDIRPLLVENVRNSYPIAKFATENLCHLYAKEYGLPVKIARLTQIVGPGASCYDNRIFSQFCRLAAVGEDIILFTSGLSSRAYCYTMDAINAIILLLLKGEKGKSYNVSNPETHISAYGLAKFIQNFCNNRISVRQELDNSFGYPEMSDVNLSIDRISKFGWKPKIGLTEMVSHLIDYYKIECNEQRDNN